MDRDIRNREENRPSGLPEGQAPAKPEAGPQVTRTRPRAPAGAVQAPDGASLGTISINVSPPPPGNAIPAGGGEGSDLSDKYVKSLRSRRNNNTTAHYRLRRRMVARRKELEALADPESENSVFLTSEQRLFLEAEIKLMKHSSGFCGDRTIPAHRRTATGKIVPTGAPGRVEIHRGGANQARLMHYYGTQLCGGVWFCEECAQRIQRKRREELQKAFSYFQDKGKTYSFVTLTFPHRAGQTFSEVVEKLSKAARELRQGKRWAKFKAKFGQEHIIRALEATWSKAKGPHPHYHLLVIYDRPSFTPLEVAEIDRFFIQRWHHLCRKYGLVDDNRTEAHLAHGCVVKTGADPTDWQYMAKTKVWEMASANTKRPRAKDILSMWEVKTLFFQDSEHGGKSEYEPVWWDYMRAFKGRNALHWSHGLKSLVGVADQDDAELAAQEQSEPLYVVPSDAYALVNRFLARHHLLDMLEVGGTTELEAAETLHLIPIIRPIKAIPENT